MPSLFVVSTASSIVITAVARLARGGAGLVRRRRAGARARSRPSARVSSSLADAAGARELVAAEAGVGPVVLVARVVDLGLGLLEKVLGQVRVIGDMGSTSRVV